MPKCSNPAFVSGGDDPLTWSSFLGCLARCHVNILHSTPGGVSASPPEGFKERIMAEAFISSHLICCDGLEGVVLGRLRRQPKGLTSSWGNWTHGKKAKPDRPSNKLKALRKSYGYHLGIYISLIHQTKLCRCPTCGPSLGHPNASRALIS